MSSLSSKNRCDEKKSFSIWADALWYSKRMAKKFKCQYKVYKCDDCEYFHLATVAGED